MSAACVGALVGGALGYGHLLRYRSEGLLSIELSISEYKRFTGVADSPETARAYAVTTPLTGWTDHAVSSLIGNVASGACISRFQGSIEPMARTCLTFFFSSNGSPANSPTARKQPTVGTQGRFIWASAFPIWGETPLRSPRLHVGLGFISGMLQRVNLWLSWSRTGPRLTGIFIARAVERKLRYEFDLKLAQSRSATLQASKPDFQSLSVDRYREVTERHSAEFQVAVARQAMARLQRDSAQHALLDTLLVTL